MTQASRDRTEYVEISGTAAERAAFNNPKQAMEWYETDTTARYKYLSGAWVLIVATGGAAPGYGGGGGGSANVTVINPVTSGANVQLASIAYIADAGNSSAAQLAAAATFNGVLKAVPSEPNAIISALMDQAYTLSIAQYDDAGATKPAGAVMTFTRAANVGVNESVQLNGNYYRVSVTNNGGSTSTTFYLDTFTGIMPVEPQALTNSGNKRIAIVEVGGTPVSGPNLPVITPLAAPVTAQQKATATATFLPTQGLVNGVVITAYTGNSGNILIGGASLTNVIDGTGNGEVLQPGVARAFAVSDLGSIKIILASGNTSTTDFVTISGN
jgi:hypothetical protein